ncbi:MAG: acyloxyacyl hydrolase [Pseudomonadota bacterium]
MPLSRSLLPIGAACAALFGASVHAADLSPSGYFLQGGLAERGANSVTGGLVWNWDWRTQMAGGEITAITEASISHWSGRAIGGGRDSFIQLGLQPIFRYRFNQGASPWFLEGGIGLTVTDKLYVTSTKTFSTRFNFADTLGFGVSMGPKRDSELGLRLTHYSNASIKRPNPGENFLQLRYAKTF